MKGLRGRLGSATEFLGLVAVLILLVAFFSYRTEHFFSHRTFITIANQVPDAVLVAVGMTFVLIIAGIDLSVGSVVALSGAVLGVLVVDKGWPLPFAALACLGMGLLCGTANGLITVRWALPSFIVTLGMLEIAQGGAYLLTESRTKWIGSSVQVIFGTSIYGLSMPFFVAVAAVILGQAFLSYSAHGRYLLAIGAREETARLSGLSVARLKVAVFMFSGLMAAVAAIVQSGRLQSVNPRAVVGFELQAIAAVVIGGTSLMGGRGSVVGSFLGVLIIAVLGNGLAQIGAEEPTKRLVTGTVIVLAVILDYYRHRFARGANRD